MMNRYTLWSWFGRLPGPPQVIAPRVSMSESELDSPGRTIRFANRGFVGDDVDNSIRLTVLFLIGNEGDCNALVESTEQERAFCTGGDSIFPCPTDDAGEDGIVSDADF